MKFKIKQLLYRGMTSSQIVMKLNVPKEVLEPWFEVLRLEINYGIKTNF